MQPAIEKLRKFFRLEAENKYANTAVIGGLAKILDFWESEARSEGVPEETVQLVASRLRDYGRLTPASRADTLKGVWKRLQGQIGEADVPAPVYAPAEEANPPEKAEPAPRPAAKPRSEAPVALEASHPAPRRNPAPRASSYPGAQTSQTPIALNARLTVLQGVGPKNASSLEKLGLFTLGDMLYYFPRRYDDYSQLKPINALMYGEVVTVIGQVQNLVNRPVRGGKMQMQEALLNDGSGALRLIWFNQPWLMNRLREGMLIAAAGRVEQYLGRLVMNNPDWEAVEEEHLHTARIVPVYGLTANITQKWLRNLMDQVVNYWAPRLSDPLPERLRLSAGLYELGRAIHQAHFPDSQEALQQARARLAFDEIFYLQMGALRKKRGLKAQSARVFTASDSWLEEQVRGLPFQLTGAQVRATADIRDDLLAGHPMNRLLQGDVGSGKTVVSVLAAKMVAESGAQTALMAPTSILAEQHYKNFRALWPEADIRLLTGDTSASERAELLPALAEGRAQVLIGTHALIEEPVVFHDLQLAVIDEQHRFGVEQRGALRAKGSSPHVLVMTATPIPRSLALTLYGDLELSVMDEMPAGRQPVQTFILKPSERERGFSLLESQIRAGRQAFIVYPLVEESEKMEEVKAAVEEHARLAREVFPGLRLGLLHGRMKADEKERVMQAFRAGEYDILVATTVIEVGVDVPNATVMLIEGANRFGLAQLHQLRGRVGRGGGESFCLLIPDKGESAENERLLAMTRSNNGFELAELDLQQRGPGEFLGTQQSGPAVSLRMASLSDVTSIEKAREQAQAMFDLDPELSAPEHALLAETLNRFWGGKGDVS